LIAKSFLFNFVNSYNSLFYIAFFKQILDTCVTPNGKPNPTYPCMEELKFQLFIVFGSMIVVNNVLEVGIPKLKSYLVGKKEQGKNDGIKSFAEKQYELADFESTFDDFDELSIQFGFVTIFVVAFPLAPVFAFVNNMLEVFVDAEKYLKIVKRPEPRGVYDIGTWLDIFSCISWVALFTNVLICCAYTDEFRVLAGGIAYSYTGDNAMDAKSLFKLVVIFIIIEHVLAIAKSAISYFIPDEPMSVKEHILRQRYLIDVIVLDAEEENDDEFVIAGAADGQEGDEEKGPAVNVKHVAEEFNLKDIPEKLDDDGHCKPTAVNDAARGTTHVEMQAQPSPAPTQDAQ